jgi:hypothetical protein
MVNIVDDWNVFKEYTGEKIGFYQTLQVDNGTEIRVLTGKIGFKKQFENKDNAELAQIKEFCQNHRFIRIVYNIREDTFFK